MPKCQVCTTRASFNFEGCSKGGRFCSKHKEEGMVDVKSKRCGYPGCKSLNPVFNEEGCKGGRFCAKHKEEGGGGVF